MNTGPHGRTYCYRFIDGSLRWLALALLAWTLNLGAGCSSSDNGPTRDAGAVDATAADATADKDAVLPAVDAAPADTVVADTMDPNTTLYLEEPCQNEVLAVVPDPGEEGQLAAARLTPPSYPFTVNAVRYLLHERDVCTNIIAHRVEIYVRSDTVPEANPASAVTIQVPAVASAPKDRWVELKLDEPIVLEDGQHIFVAVEIAGNTSNQTICLSACMGAGISDRNYWSNATQPPYSWTTMLSFQMNVNFRIQAIGK